MSLQLKAPSFNGGFFSLEAIILRNYPSIYLVFAGLEKRPAKPLKPRFGTVRHARWRSSAIPPEARRGSGGPGCGGHATIAMSAWAIDFPADRPSAELHRPSLTGCSWLAITMAGLPWAGRMIDQNAFDDVADALVAAGVRVTYESLEQAFRERDRATSGETYGKAHSRRDIQDPFDDWKRRRRYKPHFSAIELPEPAERAIAKAFAALQAAAGHLPPGFLPPEPSASGADLQARIEELADGMGRRFDELAAENAALRRDVAALARQGGQAGGRVMRKGRKSGVPYATSIFFWDYLIRQLRDAIRERGPMTAAELLALVDEDTHTLAAAAFEEIDETTLREKLAERVKRGRYLKQVGDRYEVLRRRRSASKDDHQPEEDDDPEN